MVKSGIYKTSLALHNDMYQLSMANGYWQLGRHEEIAAFNLFFRRTPFQGGYAVAAGLADALSFLEDFRFTSDDLSYLATIRGADDEPVFKQPFLDFLSQFRFNCEVHAVVEGTPVFAHEPILRVVGPILHCQLVETGLLNIINFQTLIATKAARICYSADAAPVLEFGLRRAHGIDGGLSASRAAFIGGCAATSNLLAGKTFGIPVRGTHAHSWVMCFDTEEEAFAAYAEVMPGNCVFLVDTYDTLQGVRHAIQIAQRLRDAGKTFVGIRLDSGDLAYLSIKAREMLDAAGFPDAAIVASNNLDEMIIDSLKQQGAKIGVWGVGTRLVTAYDQPALGGVYKLSAIQDANGTWIPKLKLSEQAVKISTPGLLQVKRFQNADGLVADMIYDENHPPSGESTMIDPFDPTRRRRLSPDLHSADLLEPVMHHGRCTSSDPELADIQAFARQQQRSLHHGVKRFINPHHYPVGLEQQLYETKTNLILKQRGFA